MLCFSTVANEYSEFEDEINMADNSVEVLSDNPEDHARKAGAKSHVAGRRANLQSVGSIDDPLRSPGRPELKRRRSRAELKRQLSKQLSKQASVVDEKPTERTKLIDEEKVETGTVSKVYLHNIKSIACHNSVIIMISYL